MSLLNIIFIIWFLSELALAILMKSKDNGENHDKSSLSIIWITITLSLFLGIFISNLTIGRLHYNPVYLYKSGIVLIIFGLIIRWIAIITLKKSFTVNVAVSKDQFIVRSGLYKFVRHPSYAGSLLSFLGMAVVFNNWLTMLVIFLPILTAFLHRIKIEENVLTRAFGDEYVEYCKTTYRLIPGIY